MRASLSAVAAAIAVVLVPNGHALAARVQVVDARELQVALRDARAGDTIALAPGDYGALVIANRSFDAPVAIVASDGRRPPRFSSIRLTDVVALTLQGLTVAYGPTDAPLSTYAVEVMRGRNIRLEGLFVVSADDGVRGNDAYGIFIRDSVRVGVEKSRFKALFRGVAAFDSDDVLISRNHFCGMGSDGIVLRGARRTEIADNLIVDFETIDPVKHHPDAIQIWDRGAPRSSRSVVIRNNVILRGNGDAAQGIFIKTPDAPTEALIVENNVVHQSMAQGIYLNGVRSGIVRNNTVAAFEWRKDRPGIEILNQGVGVELADNIARTFRAPSDFPRKGVKLIDYDNPYLETFAMRLISAAFEKERAHPSNFRRISVAGATPTPAVNDLAGPAPDRPPTAPSIPETIAKIEFAGEPVDRSPFRHEIAGPPAYTAAGANQNAIRFSQGQYFIASPSPAFTAAQKINVSARVRLSPMATGAWGLVAAAPGAWDLRVAGNKVRWTIRTQAGEAIRVDAAGVVLSGATFRLLTAQYDGATGAASIAVDGKIVSATAGPKGIVAYYPTRSLTIGGAPKIASFEGEIASLEISR